MKWTELVTLMDNEANRLEAENNHSAAILLRLGAEEVRRLSLNTPEGRWATTSIPTVSIPNIQLTAR